MELKTARLTLLIDPNKKAAFERLCAQQDRTASQVVRQLIRDYLAQHGVEYTAAGDETEAPVAGASAGHKSTVAPAMPPSATRPPRRRATRKP
jgi:hypothetical protein